MFTAEDIQKTAGGREDNYRHMVEAVRGMIESERDVIASLANISAVCNYYIDDINWAGFYILRGNELVLGPFQGLPACVRIPLGIGVCGTAAKERRTVIVRDVHEFPGHIACDSASNSEIVLPIFKNGEVFGVLDIDSPSIGRFGELEEQALILIVKHIESLLKEND